MKSSLKSILFFGVLILIFDQAIKVIATDKMVLGSTVVLIKNFFSLTLVHNVGAAFSLFSDNMLLLILIGIFAIIVICFYINTRDTISDADTLSYSLLIGGILGNLFDRIVRGYVIDYLSFTFGKFSFPVFNLADICIVLSIVLMIINTTGEDVWKK